MTTTAALDAPVPATPLDGIARVLVVDDEPNIRELLSLALGYEGFDVRTAADAAAAAREFRTVRGCGYVLEPGS